MKKIFILLLTISMYQILFGQAGVGIGTTTPNASSLLDLSSTTKGVLIPRMTTAQRNVIVNPVAGLQILNIDDYCLDIYDGNGWIKNCGLRIIGSDTARESVKQVANFGGTARYEAVGFSMSDKGYVGTGWDGSNKKDFWQYNSVSNIWTQKADFGGTARWGAIGFSANSYGFIGSGFDGTYRKDFWRYDPISNTWTQKTDCPGSPRNHAIGVGFDGSGFFGMGQNQSMGVLYSDMYEYIPIVDVWITKNSCPFTGYSLVALSLQYGIYIGVGIADIPFFGVGENSIFFYFNPAGPGTWTQKAFFPGTLRSGAVGLAMGGRGYVMTGRSESSTYLNDIWEYTWETDSWERKSDLGGSGRGFATGFSINNVGYVGTGYDGAAKSDFYTYEPFPMGPVYQNTLDVAASGGIEDGIWKKEYDQISTDHRINIAAATRTLTHPDSRQFYFSGDIGLGSNGAEFCRSDGRQGIGLGYGYIYAAGTDSDQDLGIAAKGGEGDIILSAGAVERMRITSPGWVGIGTSTPHSLLQFSNADANRKIVFYEAAINDHQYSGFGSTGGSMRYQVNATTNDHVFFAGASSSASNELMRIKGNGKVGMGMGLTNPLNRFDINNGAANRTGTHGTGLAMYVTGDFGAASNGVEFRNNDATQGIGFGSNTIYAAGTNTSQDLNFIAKGATGNFSVSTSGTERMKITGNGFTGFNVATPLSILDISFGPRTGVHGANNALYVTGWGEFRTADATQGLGIFGNQMSATGTNASVDLTMAAKGASGNLSFSTNGSEKLKITGAGNFGFGVSAPANKIDVHNGTARTNTHNTGQALYVTGGGEFRSADATTGLGIGSNNIFATGSNANVDLSLAAKGASGNIIFNTNGGEKVRISNSGNVGIGTSTPHAQLQLATSVANRKLVLYEVADNDNQFHGFGIDGFGALRYQTANPSNDHVFYSASSPTTSLELFRITGSGLVGIGVTAPHAALHFSNTINTKKVVLYEYANNTSEFSGFGLDGDGSMRYEVPTENAEHVFYTGAGPNGFIELMRLGSTNGLTIEKGTTINSTLTTTGNVTIGGTLTVNSAIVTEAFISPAFVNNNFSNYNAGYSTAAYYKDKMGIVHLRGLVTRATSHDQLIIFNLPAGYRPSTSGKLLFSTQAMSGLSRIDILPNGDVVVTAASTGWITLDGIAFRAD